MRYLPRIIDKYLEEWANQSIHKPLLVRGARQVGKSWAIRHLGERFKHFIEVNFEKNPEYKSIFEQNLDVERITLQLSILCGKPIIDGETLLFLDEIQDCQQAIMSLRFFKEDRPGLHVVAAGSLLEFTLSEIPTFGVGRIHSIFMYPMTFDEFLWANGEERLMALRDWATYSSPLPEVFHNKLVDLFRMYMLVGGFPEVVMKWVETGDYHACQETLNDIILGYEDDFAKYRKKCDPELLKQVFRSAALQLNRKFTYADVNGGYKTYEVKKAVNLLEMAGILCPVCRTSANGVPLGSEVDKSYCKILTIDSGLTLRLLGMSTGADTNLKQQILTASTPELVNKGPLAELIAGLELIRYQTPNLRHEIYYWAREERNSLAEVDYVISPKGEVLPIEIKSGTKGGMKSLWLFMRAKKLTWAVRSSLENFGMLTYIDSEADDSERQVIICPLYALSSLERLL